MKSKKSIIWFAAILLLVSSLTVLGKPLQYAYHKVSSQNSAQAAEPPYFTGVTDKSVEVGSLWSPFEGVQARDPAQSNVDISGYIDVEDNVRINKWGTYKVYYTVKSPTSGLEAKAERTIKVIVPGVSTAVLTVPATKEIKVGDAFTSKVAMEGVTAVDGDGTNLKARVSWEPSTVDTSTVGNHTLVYKVTGKNGEETSATSVIKVVEGSNEVVNDATINVSDRTITEGDTFDYYEGVSAYDGDSARTDLTNRLTYQGRVNANSPGRYSVIYKVTGANGTEVTKTVTITVIKKAETLTNAVIQASDRTIALNDSFDYMAGVTAVDGDESSTNLTSSITYSGSVDTAKAGTYPITYKVTGKNNREVSKTIRVTVTAKDAVITANDRTIQLGQSFEPLSGVRATDMDGRQTDLTASLSVKENNVDSTKAGEYRVVYTVTGTNGRAVEKAIKVTVIANNAEITALDKVVYKGETFNPLNGVTAIDGDGRQTNLTANLTIERNTVNTDQAGEYEIVYSVIGSNGVKVTKSIKVTVITKQGELTIAKKVHSENGGDLNNQTVFAGDKLIYKITVQNPVRDSEVIGVQISDVLPEGVETDRQAITVSGTNAAPELNGRTLTLTAGTLSGNGKIELTIPVTIKSDFEGQLANTATVRGETVDAKDSSVAIGSRIPNQATILASDQELILGHSFDPLEGVSAVDRDGTDISSSLRIVTNTVNTNRTGIYKVVYEAETSKGEKLTKEIKVEVLGHDATLVAENQELHVGDSFDPLSIVSALDGDGSNTDISSRITIIKNNVDTAASGEYEVTYQIVGGNGKTVRKTITVRVEANDAVIHAENKSGVVGETFDPYAQVTAFDGDGRNTNLTARMEIKLNTVDTAHAGNYKIRYEVTGENGHLITKTIDVTIIAKDASIEAENKYLRVGAEFDPLEGISATDGDGYDTDLTASINITANNVDLTKAGNYEITYSVRGANRNLVTKTITVTVGENPGDLSISKSVTTENGKATATVGDELLYTLEVKNPTTDGTVHHVKVTDDLPKGVELITDSIKVDGQKTNDYDYTERQLQLDFAKLDAKTTKTITFRVTVKNEVGATIINVAKVSGENSTNDSETSVVTEREYEDARIEATDKTLTVGDEYDPLAGIRAVDNDKQDLTPIISLQTNTVDTFRAGIYKVIYAVTGKSGNLVTKEITVTVVAKNAVIVAEDHELTLGDPFDPMHGVKAYDGDIHPLAKTQNAIAGSDITEAVSVEKHNVDPTKVGKYQVVYTVTGSNGITVKHTRKVTVLAKNAVIKADDQTLKIGDDFKPLVGVKAYDGDEKNTEITDRISVEANDVNSKKVGNYKVTYAVRGSNQTKVIRQIKVTVEPNEELSGLDDDNESIVEDPENEPTPPFESEEELEYESSPEELPVISEVLEISEVVPSVYKQPTDLKEQTQNADKQKKATQTKHKKLLQAGDEAALFYTIAGMLLIIAAWVIRKKHNTHLF